MLRRYARKRVLILQLEHIRGGGFIEFRHGFKCFRWMAESLIGDLFYYILLKFVF